MDIKARLKSYPLWIAFFALIPLVAQAFGFQLPVNYEDLINGILALLVAAGILNSPVNGTGYKDE